MINQSPSTAVARRPLQWLNAARYLLKRQGSLNAITGAQTEQEVHRTVVSSNTCVVMDALHQQMRACASSARSLVLATPCCKPPRH